MTPHSRVAALAALLLAAAAHAAPAFLQSSSTAEIQGGNTALASQGDSFANLVQGSQSTEVALETTDAKDATKQPKMPPIEKPVEPPAEPPVDRVVQQQIKDVVEPQLEPPQDIASQQVIKPVEHPTEVEPLEMAVKEPQMQGLLTIPPALPFQSAPPVETLEPLRSPPQQSQQQPPETVVKPVEQPQVLPKPETLTPVPDPQPKPKPKPKPRGNNTQNAARGTVDGQNAMPGGLANTVAGKAQVQGNAAASNYGGQVVRQILRHKRSISIKGTAKISFSIRPDGSLATLQISQSSGSGKLDRFFLKTVSRAAPFPPPPPGAKTKFGVELHGRR